MTQNARRVDENAARLESIGPTAVLQRGYSLTKDEGGAIVRSIADVKAGQNIKTVVSDGMIDSTVKCSS